jgi:hypothetical protein
VKVLKKLWRLLIELGTKVFGPVGFVCKNDISGEIGAWELGSNEHTGTI